MAKKKFLAYAKNNEGIYIKNENSDTDKLFNIWDVLRMKENHRNIYDQLTFWSIPRNEKFRKEMVAVKNAFFRYKNTENSSGGQGETITHSVVIEVLSQLKELPLQFGDKLYRFEIEDCSEDARFQFGEEQYYYPDLYIKFRNPQSFVEKWGGRVAIEVFVTHQVDDKKKLDFRNHNIPVIEINISEKLHFHKKEFDEKDYLNYVSFLKRRFEECIYAKVIVDIETLDFRKKTIIRNEKELKESINLNKKCISEISKMKETYLKNTSELNLKLTDYQSENEKLKTEITALNNQTFFQKLIKLFS